MAPNKLALVSLVILVISCEAEINNQRFELHPKSTMVDQGENVILSCVAYTTSSIGCPTDEYLRWLRDTQGNSPEYVAYCNKANITLEGRFTVELDMETFMYNLTIHDVQPEDAGEYWCELNYDRPIYSSNKASLTVRPIPKTFSVLTSTILTTDPFCSSAASGQKSDNSIDGTISSAVTPDQISTSTFGTSDENVLPTAKMTRDHPKTVPPIQISTENVKGDISPPRTLALNEPATITVQGTYGNSPDHDSFGAKVGQDQSPTTATPLKELESDRDDETGGFPVWVIVGGVLGLVFLLIVVASCASYLKKYKGKVAKKPNGCTESGVQEAPGEEDTAPTTTVLQINPIYDGLSQDTYGLPELGKRAASSDEAEEAKAATYAVPDKTGRGEVRHIMVSPLTSDTDPGLVSSSLVSKEAASVTKGGVPSENATYATLREGSQTLSTSAASKAPRADSTPPRSSNKSASPEVFEPQQTKPEHSYVDLDLPCPPTAKTDTRERADTVLYAEIRKDK